MARMDDGHSTKIGFSAGSSSGLLIYQKEVTPPSVQAGGEIDTTTMDNDTYRTKWPKTLKTLGNASILAAYESALYPQLVAMVGVNQLITVTFPDGSTLAFWGWIDEFTPNRVVEGEQPTAEVTIIASNQNNSKVEVAPVQTPAP